MTKIDAQRKQLNTLLNGIKAVVTDTHCPPWVKITLESCVKTAKAIEADDHTTEAKNEPRKASIDLYETDSKRLEVGDYCVSTMKNDECIYQIVEEDDPLEFPDESNGEPTTRMFIVKIVKGNAENPIGHVCPNVGNNLLRHIVGEVKC